MKKYRIIKVSEATVSENTEGIKDFIPKVGVEIYYRIEEKSIDFLWGIFSIYYKYPREFNTLERAEKYIEYLKLIESVNQEKIVKEL